MHAKKRDLETALKEKVEPILEETMEKHLGITIPKIEADISDKLKHPHFNIYIPFHLPFSQAKKAFQKEFLKNELQTHQGNISHLAKTLDIDRRSIHRTIKDLKIKIKDIRTKPLSPEKYQEDAISDTIRSTLEQYEEIIQPQKMEKIYQEVRSISKNIAKFIPKEELTWKDAEKEFEKQFLHHSLEENHWNTSLTAKKIQIRPETLSRKIKKLGLKK